MSGFLALLGLVGLVGVFVAAACGWVDSLPEASRLDGFGERVLGSRPMGQADCAAGPGVGAGVGPGGDVPRCPRPGSRRVGSAR